MDLHHLLAKARSAIDIQADAGLLLENLEDAFGRSADHGSITNDRNRPLHEFWMCKEKFDHGIFAHIVGGIETEFGKVAVVSNHVGNRVGQLGDDVSEGRLIEGVLQILDHREIDFAFF